MSIGQKLLLLIISIFFLTGCDSSISNIDTNSLIGMSKEEILKLIFEKCPKDKYGETNIGAWEIENGRRLYLINFYYKSIQAAMKDDRLMNKNIWEMKAKCKFPFSIYQKEESLEIYFEKGYVIKVKRKYWYKT